MHRSPYILNSEPYITGLDTVIVGIVVNNTDTVPIVKVDLVCFETLKL